VRLRWQTLAEHGSSFFAVERSSDLRLWERIGQVEAAGTSAEPRTYQFYDAYPVRGAAYYRLKQADAAGGYVYSEVREIAGPLAAQLRVVPNPAAAAVSVEGDPAELAALRICSLTGQDLSRWVTVQAARSGSLTLDLTRLPAGMYLLVTPLQVQRMCKE
jgi:hypothetical protein